MTSGQGGSSEQPTGQPGERPGDGGGQGWNPPPQQPPGYPAPPQQPPGYPAPPQQPPGYPAAPPPSYPPAPGYAPAPPGAWGGGPAPRPVERPATVRAGLGAFIASLVLGVVTSVFLFTDQSGVLDAALARSGADVDEDVLRSALIVGAVIGLVFVALQAMFIWFAWQGRNWARVVLWVLGGLGIVSGLTTVFGGTPYGGFYTSLSIIQFLLVLAGVILLAMGPSNEWYRYRGWLRATGQGR